MGQVKIKINFYPSKKFNDSNFTFSQNNYSYTSWARGQSIEYLKKKDKIEVKEKKKVFIDWDIDILSDINNTILVNFNRENYNLRELSFDGNKNLYEVIFNNKDYRRLILVKKLLEYFEMINEIELDFLNGILYPWWSRGYLNTEGLIGYESYFTKRAFKFFIEHKILEIHEIKYVFSSFISEDVNLSSKNKDDVLSKFLNNTSLCFATINFKECKINENFLDTLHLEFINGLNQIQKIC